MTNLTAWIIAFFGVFIGAVNAWFMARCWRDILRFRRLLRELEEDWTKRHAFNQKPETDTDGALLVERIPLTDAQRRSLTVRIDHLPGPRDGGKP